MKKASLEARVRNLEERNRRVEGDKAWETSWARRVIIFALTYAAMFTYFLVIGIPQPFLNALVPSLAFVISTLSLPYFKRMWMAEKGRA